MLSVGFHLILNQQQSFVPTYLPKIKYGFGMAQRECELETDYYLFKRVAPQMLTHKRT